MTAPRPGPDVRPLLALAATLAAAAASGVLVLALRGGLLGPLPESRDAASAMAGTDTAATVARGAYLARLGNCVSCHTARGGAPSSALCTYPPACPPS